MAFDHVQHAMSMSCSLLFDIYLTDTNTCSFQLALLTTACSYLSWPARSRKKSGHMDVSSWRLFAPCSVGDSFSTCFNQALSWFIILFCGKLLFGCPAEKTLRTFSCPGPGSPLAFKECRQWTVFLTTWIARHGQWCMDSEENVPIQRVCGDHTTAGNESLCPIVAQDARQLLSSECCCGVWAESQRLLINRNASRFRFCV